jgi:hypothetical protein
LTALLIRNKYKSDLKVEVRAMKLKIFPLTALALLLTASAFTTSSIAGCLHESHDELFRHPLFVKQAERLVETEQTLVQEGASVPKKVTFAEPECTQALQHQKHKSSQHQRLDSLAYVDAMGEVIQKGWDNVSASFIARVAEKDEEVATKYVGPQELLSDALRKADLLGRLAVNFHQLALKRHAQKSPPRRTVLTGSLFLDRSQ